MSTDRQLHGLRYRARVVVETLGPLSIASGHNDAVFDTALARDANGLPVLPGTSIAGVLRAAWRDQYGEDPEQLFGCSARSHEEAAASRVTVSFGHIHDAADRPVDGLVLDRARLQAETLLAPLLADDLPHRDHVALDHRGVARDTGKFDRSYVPAGHRFSFDLALEAAAVEDAKADWKRLLALLGSPGFRLGGATRRGYGALKVVRLAAACFDLRKPEDRAAFSALPVRLDRPAPQLSEVELPQCAAEAGWDEIRIALVPEDFWRVGQGRHSYSGASKKPDALPYSEHRVFRDAAGRARSNDAVPEVVLPASSIKGALAHRIAFHDRCLAGRFADQCEPADLTQASEGVEALFGCVKDADGGFAGHVLIDDLRLSVAPQEVIAMQHNSLDRFTGGTRDGVLYAEELVAARPPELSVRIRKRAFEEMDDGLRVRVQQALARALGDLCEGRLALGAAQAKGHGYFSGTILSAPAWLQGDRA